MLPSRAGTHLQLHNFERSWRRARGEDFATVTTHTVRKSVADAVETLGTVKQAAAQLGHADEAVTKEYYLPTPKATGVSALLGDWQRSVHGESAASGGVDAAPR